MKSCRRLCRVICAWSLSAAAIAQTYPGKPVRFIVPFAEADASGHVSRRPARGKDAQAAGFYATANTILQQYPAKSVRFIVPFAPGGGNDIIARIIKSEVAKWGRVVKASGAKVE